MRDDIEAAITALGDDSGMEPAPIIEPDPNVKPIEVKDEEGEAAKAQAKTETPAIEASGKEKDVDGATDGSGDVVQTPDPAAETVGIEKAPEAWQPAAREGWKELPESVRTQIHKRETEINKALMDGSENRKRGEQFNDIAGRYAQVIAAEGVTDPITGFEEMMKVMSVLRMGTPEQKAKKLAQFIGGYGVSVELLDDILSGQPSIGGGNGAAAIGDPNMAYIDQKLAPVNELLGRLNEQDRKVTFDRNQAYMTEVVKFKADNEFYTDVQHDMADLCEMSAKRGYDMPLAEAYTKACAMNPEISKVIADRGVADRLQAGSETLISKRNAASSITGNQNGALMGGEDLDLRGTIEAAFDAQAG